MLETHIQEDVQPSALRPERDVRVGQRPHCGRYILRRGREGADREGCWSVCHALRRAGLRQGLGQHHGKNGALDLQSRAVVTVTVSL